MSANQKTQESRLWLCIHDWGDFLGCGARARAVYVTMGQTKGATLLPLPPTERAPDGGGGGDKERIHTLESAVVTWTRQIKNVLKTDPEAALKEGLNPGPLTEARAPPSASDR